MKLSDIKVKILMAIIMVAAFFFVPLSYAASGCTVTGERVLDRWSDHVGEHFLFQITVTQTGTTFSFTEADFPANVRQYWRGFIYWIGIDPTGTLDAAPQLTITDAYNYTQFSDTTNYHVSNPIKRTGNSYDGQYVHISPGMTWSFNDVGSSEVLTIHIDVVR